MSSPFRMQARLGPECAYSSACVANSSREATGHFVDQDDVRRIGAAIAQSQSMTQEEFEAMFDTLVPDATKGPQNKH